MYHYHDDFDEPCHDDHVAENQLADFFISCQEPAADFAADDYGAGQEDYVEPGELGAQTHECCADCGAAPAEQPTLHRLAEVRQMQHVTVRDAQRHLHLTPEEIRRQEQPDCDLRLSELYAWQRLLGVPIAELFADPGLNLSPPVQKRAEMVKVMKTAATLVDKARQPNVLALARRLVEQLLEVMPELKGVGPWPSVGVRRTKQELGRAALGIRLPREILLTEAIGRE